MHNEGLKTDLLMHYGLQGMPFVHCSGVFPLLEKQALYLSLDRVPLTKPYIYMCILITDQTLSCLKVIFVKN